MLPDFPDFQTRTIKRKNSINSPKGSTKNL